MRLRLFFSSVLALLAMSCSSVQGRHVTNPFPSATQVRLFVEVGYSDKRGEPILSKPNGLTLSEEQRRQFEEALVVTKAPDEMAACFVPHHFFRYYNAKGKQVGEVQICFCCEGVLASGSNKLQTDDSEIVSADYTAIASLVESLDEPTDDLCP